MFSILSAPHFPVSYIYFIVMNRCINYCIYFLILMLGNGIDVYDELHGRGKVILISWALFHLFCYACFP